MAALSLAFWVLYRVTRTWLFSYDSLTNALEIEAIGFSDVRTPAHLLPTLIGAVFYNLFQALHHPVRALSLAQRLNALWAALAVGILYRSLRHRWASGTALLGAVALGVTFTFWCEAVDPGLYPASGLIAAVAVGVLIDTEPISPWLCGMLAGVAILVHEMFVFLAPSLFLGLLSRRDALGRRTKLALQFFTGFLIAGLLPMGLLVWGRSHNSAEVLRWLFSPPGQRPRDSLLHHQFWSTDIPSNLGFIWSALQRAVSAPFPLTTHGLKSLWVAIVQIILLATGGYVGFDLVRRYRDQDADRHRVALLDLWILLMGIFQFFFAVGVERYKILFWPALIASSLFALENGPRVTRQIYVTFILLLSVVNGIALWPASRTPAVNSDLVRINWVRRVVQPQDYLLITGKGKNTITNVALLYFLPEVPARSLFGVLYESYGVPDFYALEDAMQRTWQSGGQVYWETALRDREVQAQLLVPSEPLASWIARFQTGERLEGPDGYALERLKPNFKQLSSDRPFSRR